jgi:hypothetical protein
VQGIPQLADAPIKMSESLTLDGQAPVVLLGPNGAGKTRHAVQLAAWNHADLVPALRNIALPPDLPMQSVSVATRDLSQHLNHRRKRPWDLSNEINQLFSKLMAEDSSAATRFRDSFIAGEQDGPERTKLMALQESWARLFPGRHIDFSGHHPVVRSEYATTTEEYPAQQMSDGERVALYLAARVLDSDSSIIIIDEPEVHFHSRLGARFWNDMEQIREDVRFIYITHDLAFALSRCDATFVVIRPNTEPTVIELDRGLPKDLSESLLAAASFSIFAKRIVFCEGVEGASLDQALYSAWFNCADTAVVPVETSANVSRCAEALSSDRLIAGLTAQGIVDRDYWPSQHLVALPDSVFPLPVHEVENLLCLRGVFSAVAVHLGMSSDDADAAFEQFLHEARGAFSDELMAKQIIERVKRRCEHEFRMALGGLRGPVDAATISKGLDPGSWESSVEAIVAEETTCVGDAASGPEAQFHQYMPGKVFWKRAASKLGVTADRYRQLVCLGLTSDREDHAELARSLEQALNGYLPDRSIGDA